MTEPTKPEFDDVLPAESDDEVCSTSPGGQAMPAEEESRKSTDDVMDLIASVEDQLEKMKSAQVNRSCEIETLESRREDLSRREQKIQIESNRLETVEAELETRLAKIVERENDFCEQNDSMERMRTALAADSDDMARREKELSDIQSQCEEDKSAIVLEQGRLAGQRAELESAQSAFELEADQLKSELESAQEAVSATDSIRISLEEQADRLRNEHEQMMHRIEESDSRADSFKAEAESLQAGTIELAEKLESAADVIEKLESERSVIDDELKICKLERDESCESARLATEERDEIKSSLELAMDRLQALAQAVSEQASQLDEGAIAISRCRELEERMVTLSRELEEAHDRLNHASAADPDFDPGFLDRSNEEISRLRSELESCVSRTDHEAVVNDLNARIESMNARGFDATADLLTEQLDEARSEIDTLESHARACEERITEKERHLAELQMRNEELESTASVGQSSVDVSSDAQLLRDQAKRLSAFASHLQLRRVRLREMRRLLAARGGSQNGQTGSVIESERLIRVEKEDMVRRRHEMSELESRMLRRWACHATAGTVVKISVLLVVLASACWFGTRWFAPGTVASTALVRAHPITGGALDDATGTSWNDWHKAILSDDLFVKSVFKRFHSTSLGGVYSAKTASAMLGSNLVVTEVEPGMLQIRLHGSSPLETQRLLESVVATLSAESQRQLARRGDGARVDVMNTDGRLVVNDPVPVTGGQFQTAGLAFGGSIVALGLLGGGVYARLRRSRRIFDENIGIDSSSME